ncbi:hypothetical protein RJT34_03394 [Clitoria ternatea]|uniref:Anther-specific protein BCP1 n=1 Tax=Clitoria ternatea TaxID=43366 RepID=A0AAN9KM44_CLITE
MARTCRVVILGLVMFVLIAMAYANEAADAPSNTDDYDDDGDDEDFNLGHLKTGGGALSPNSVVPGPLGGPVPPGAFDTPPASAAASTSLNHLAGAAAITLAGFFYF